MLTVAKYVKDPGATLDYSLDWGSWLQANETIPSASWAITPSQDPQDADVVVANSSVTGSVTTVWLSSGVVGCQYRASCTVTTSAGRTDVRSILLDVELR